MLIALLAMGCASGGSPAKARPPAPKRPRRLPPLAAEPVPPDLPPPGSPEVRLRALAVVLAVEEGDASYYADALAGNATASGEPYEPDSLVAAHRELPFGTIVRVTNLRNERQVVVRIVDRGPWGHEERIIDLSRRAAEALDAIDDGVVPVRLEILEYGGGGG